MSKPYAALSAPERWQWHAEVHAFRRVSLGVPVEEKTSPCDPEGTWFSAELTDEAERRLRAKRGQRRVARERVFGEEAARAGRSIANEWARSRGYDNFDSYMAIERIDYSMACVIVAKSILAREVDEAPKTRASAAEALGVRAWEPSAEELRRGRVALGLE